MRWTRKAKIQKLCAVIPYGDHIYRQIQRRLGTLNPSPFNRLPHSAGMLSRLRELQFDVDGTRCMEVGTGHLPIAPVALYLAGAREVVTVDLHRRIDVNLTVEMLRQLTARGQEVVDLLAGIASEDLVRERLSIIAKGHDRVFDLFEQIGIRYIGPGDAKSMPEPDASFDLHFSFTCLEHIEPQDLAAILTEGRRLLRPLGIAAHLIDTSDHFAHQDETINRINFLRFTESEWSRIGGNEFSYCNRLRAPQLLAMFAKSGLQIVEADSTVDERSLGELQLGFPVDSTFSRFSAPDLAITTLDVYARPDLATQTGPAQTT
jgi:SAM-dependent methyltransferase